MATFVPTQAEFNLVSQILAVTDSSKRGLVTGDAAVKVFSGANLSPNVLAEIWAIADNENKGFLTRNGLSAAVRLISHAQKGDVINPTLLDKRTFRVHTVVWGQCSIFVLSP